jgi:glutamate dehydrogenase
VAGNEIRILHRNYGQNAKIVAIADGTGVGEDPDGLNHDELLRCSRRSGASPPFDKKKLGRAAGRHRHEPSGEMLRNTMHNRIPSDVFVPGGGRPNTIDDCELARLLDRRTASRRAR